MKKRTVTLLLLLLSSTALAARVDDEGPEDPGGGGGGGGGGDEPPPTDTRWRIGAAGGAYYGPADWGAGYHLDLFVAGDPSTTSPSGHDELEASGGLSSYAKLNGHNVSLLSGRVRAKSIAQSGTILTADLYAGPAHIYSRTWNSRYAVQQQLQLTEAEQVTFFDSTVNMYVGPVPVSFTASAIGEIGLQQTGRIDNTGVTGTFEPYAGASLEASAAIGGEYCISILCVGARAGVEVRLTLIDLSLPFAVTAGLRSAGDGTILDVALKGTSVLETLSGVLSVFAEAYLGDLDYRWSTPLISWTGSVITANLLDRHASTCLRGSCLAASTGATTAPGTMR